MLAKNTVFQIILVLLFNFRHSVADKTVYLQRTGQRIGNTTSYMAEPYFSPKSITADVGEKVHFLANFSALPPPTVSPSKKCARIDY